MGIILPAIFVGRKLGLKGQELTLSSLGRTLVGKSGGLHYGNGN